jgi:hypothetical protein
VTQATAAPRRIPRRVAPEPARLPGARHLRLVDPTVRRAARRRRWLVRTWALAIVLAALVGVMAHAFMAEGQQQVDRMDDEIARAERRYDEARLRVALLGSPAAVVARAREMGMVASPSPRPFVVRSAERRSPVASATRAWQDVKPELEANR